MSFIFKITTTTSPQTFVIPCVNIGTFNATVDYGDGTGSQTVTNYNDSNLTHSFATAGQHTITIDGTFPNVKFYNNQESRLLIDEVVDLGDVGWVHLYRAFRDCSNLTTFNLGTGNISNVADISQWFERCVSLTTLDLSSLDTSSVTNTNYMFQHCTGLTAIDLSNFDTSSVTSMASMFGNCTSLTSLDVSNFDTSNVTTMQEMFRDCTSLTSLDLSNFNTSNVTTVYGMFRFCKSLTTLDISSFDTSNVINMSLLFFNCRALTSIDVSNFNTAKVYNMSIMFRDCLSLTTLDVTNFDTSNVEDFTAMFYYCNSLTTLDLTNFNTSSAIKLTSMLQYCSGLTTIDVNSFDTSNVLAMLRMFSHCTSLTTLDLSNFNTLNVSNMHQLFYGCKSLTTLDVTSFDTSNVVNMTQMFRNCHNLTTLNLSSFNTSKINDIGYMFASCFNLTSLDISNFDTSNVTIMYATFQNCRSLTSLDLSSFNTSNVTTMYQMFYDCELLQNLDVKHFNVSNVIGATNFLALSNDALTTTQYDELLEAWAVQDVQPNVSWKFGNVKYTSEAIADWYNPRSASSLSIINNKLVSIADSTAAFGAAQQVDNLIIGNTYKIVGTATCSNSSASLYFRVSTNLTLTPYTGANILTISAVGTVEADAIFIATATTHYVGTIVTGHAANDTLTLDAGITVKEITNYTEANEASELEYSQENVFGSEQITNGGFDTDSDWVLGNQWQISNGKANGNGTGGQLKQILAAPINAGTYTISYDISEYISGVLRVGFEGILGTDRSSNGSFTDIITITSVEDILNFNNYSRNFVGSIDNVSVKEITNAVIYKNIPQSARELYSLDVDTWTGSGNVVTNGDFANDSGWYKDANWSISGGKATSTGSGRMFQVIAPLETRRKTVKVTFDITARTQGGVVVNCYGIESQLFNSVGTHTFSGVTTNTLNLYFNNSGAGGNFIGSIDNVSVKEVIEVAS